MPKTAWIIFIVALCLLLLLGAYRAFRHEEARPATPPAAAWWSGGFQASGAIGANPIRTA
jgi:hypothetical protein